MLMWPTCKKSAHIGTKITFPVIFSAAVVRKWGEQEVRKVRCACSCRLVGEEEIVLWLVRHFIYVRASEIIIIICYILYLHMSIFIYLFIYLIIISHSPGIVNQEPRYNRSIHREHLSLLIHQCWFSDDATLLILWTKICRGLFYLFVLLPS